MDFPSVSVHLSHRLGGGSKHRHIFLLVSQKQGGLDGLRASVCSLLLYALEAGKSTINAFISTVARRHISCVLLIKKITSKLNLNLWSLRESEFSCLVDAHMSSTWL